jgi:GNAT superfamily N-acetyltransferase
MSAPPAAFVSADHALLDLDAVHAFLSTCYWSPGLSRERMERAITHSLCWGAYDPSELRKTPAFCSLPSQVGFARVVTDRASYAYLCDVYVLESHRGRGLAKMMMASIMACPDLRGIRRFDLFTRDAHELYKHYGFGPTPDPSRLMERVDKEGYKQP